MSRAKVRILVLDDHAIVREGLRLLLERQPDFEVAGEVSTLEAALATTQPFDVVLADLVLGAGKGPDVVTALRERFPDSHVLVLTMVDNLVDVRDTLAAGARGYVLKEGAATELAEAIRTLAKGGDYLQPSLGAALARQAGLRPTKLQGTTELSDRERQVLELVVRGHTNAEIASRLLVSQRTVETHRAHILEKTGVRTRAELVRYALESGMVDLANS